MELYCLREAVIEKVCDGDRLLELTDAKRLPWFTLEEFIVVATLVTTIEFQCEYQFIQDTVYTSNHRDVKHDQLW